MKTRTILLASLLIWSGATFAQKLSPTTELMLLNRQSSTLLKSNTPEEGDAIGTFVKLKSHDAIQKIEALGGHLCSELSDRLVTMTLPIDQLRTIAAIDDVEYVQMGNEVRLNMNTAREDIGADKCHELAATTGNYTGEGVVIGIIDTGIELGHPAYYTRDGQTLRIKRLWNQNSRLGVRPEGFSYGREYKTESDILAAKYDILSSYHGGHVTGCATGADMASGFYGVAPDADIVFVSTDLSTTGVIDGVKYIFDYAKSVNKPCVINISLGTHYGPHNGTSIEDQSYKSLAGPGRIIVGAAGNEGDTKLHASKTLATEEADSMAVMVQPYYNTYSSTPIDIWGEAGTHLTIRAVVANSSTGKVLAISKPLSTDSATTESLNLTYNGRTYQTQVSTNVNSQNNQPNITLFLTGQASTNLRMGFTVQGEAGTTIHAWSPYSYEFAVPSASLQRRGWTPGDTNYTVGETGGTGEAVISVGSYNTKLQAYTINNYVYSISESAVGSLNDISLFSSRGPTADERQKPDITAPGCGIIAPYSQYFTSSDESFSTSYATGKTTFNDNDYYYTMTAGTSMAAPITAGTIALWLQADSTLTYEKIREVFKQTARHDSYTGEATDENNNTWGAGKIDAFAGLQYVIENRSNTSGINDALSTDNGVFKIVTHRDQRTAEVLYAGSNEAATVGVYNVQGQLIATYCVSASGQSIDLSSLSNGVYVFKLQHGGNTQTVKTAL